MDSSSFDYRSLLPTSRSSYDHQNDTQQQEQSQGGLCTCFGYVIELPQLTIRERMIGCITCMIGGYILSLGSLLRIFDLLFHHNPYPMVINTTIGNIITLTGSFFLSGPQQQIKRMFTKKRIHSTYMYLGSLFGTLFLLLIIPGNSFGKGLLLLLCLVFQYMSVFWYCLSYIPFAHETVRNFISQYYSGIRSSSGDTFDDTDDEY